MNSLRRATSFLLLSLLISCAQLGKTRPSGFSILQGLTTETSAEFTVLARKGSPLRLTVITPQGETLPPEKSELVTRETSPWVIHKVRFAGLVNHPGNFQLVVEESTQVRDQRTFGLFSNQGDKLRFAVGSCMSDAYPDEQKVIWSELARQRPEWLFLIGDNVYVNTERPEVTQAAELWERYAEARQQHELYFMKHLIPTYAVWDDNDYGQNNGGKHYALKEETTAVFRAFFAQSFGAEYYTPGPGVAGRLDLRGMHFTFLDNRSFRDLPGDGEHFGTEQEDWLFEDLKKSQLPTWIISGDQFFGGYHQFESFEGTHPRAFEKFLGRLKEIPTPFVFVSGDRHMSEIMQFPRALLGQLSFEFTTSPLHSKLYPGKSAEVANPWRVVMHDSSMNFMVIDSALQEASWNIHADFWGEKGSLFKRELSLTTEALKDFTIEKRQRRRRYRRARWRR